MWFNNRFDFIVALRNEKGSYNRNHARRLQQGIVALRNEKGSYNNAAESIRTAPIVALRNEKGSYNGTSALFAST